MATLQDRLLADRIELSANRVKLTLSVSINNITGNHCNNL